MADRRRQKARLTIKPVDPASKEVMDLVEQLDEYQSLLYPPESNHLDSIDALSKSSVFFLAAYRGSQICGIGSVKLIDDYGEIKRVYVPSNQRGKGIATAIMRQLESRLIKLAVTWARLETGIHQKEAIQMYEKLGYYKIAPFGEYKKDPLSVFMEKKLPEGHPLFPDWLVAFMQQQKIVLWGAADLRDFDTPTDSAGQHFPGALSFAIPMTPAVMAGIQKGPNQAYADEYARVNALINAATAALEAEIKRNGHRAQLLAASARTDPVNIRGDFPHKTAATRAGLGWIGRHCQLITRKFGSWVRLGTVFTDMRLACATPVERGYCGTCVRCVDACPAGALKGSAWVAGMPRAEILDAGACDRWKKENYFQFHQGHNCGICSAVCPYGLKILKSS